MRNETRDRRRVLGWALPASAVLHALIAGLLVFGLPVSLPLPEKEPAISVELVPPPEPSEEAEAQPPPPAEEPEPEERQEAKDETEPPESRNADKQASIPVLRPVFEFGEKDAGPRISAEGNSARDGSTSAAKPPEADEQTPAGPPAMTAAEAPDQAQPPEAAEAPASRPPAFDPQEVARLQKALELQEAKILYSDAATGDPVATKAMGNLPRGVRAGRLCVTELREQLLNTLPPYYADLLPSFRLESGTVIDAPRTAFRANRQWYDLSYRCEVDQNATRVVSFAFQVGKAVPRDEWQRRKLPAR